ncbi:hypothetical protein MXB_2206 [Myxobolus squamalis]|nr:hypothetical protein MXB_2206 [Myxobolus squamalis]
MRSIGELECMQFLNRNEETPAFSRKYTRNIIWCEEMERKIRFLEETIKSEDLTPFDNGHNVEAPYLNQFGELENEINVIVNQIEQCNSHISDLRKGYNELVEYRLVLRNTDKFDNPLSNSDEDVLIQNFNMISGIISRAQINQFEQFIWRACRGNIFIQLLDVDEEIQDPLTSEKQMKTVFVLYLQGNQLDSKVRKICEAFQASIYSAPENQDEKTRMSIGLMSRIKDVELILFQTSDQRKIIFNEVIKNFNIWRAKILKIKAIFATLNRFSYDTGSRTLVADCWCPSVFVEKVKSALVTAQEAENSDIPAILNTIRTNRQPPTYYLNNKFSIGFQNLVDAYGVATYKEANPALFMIITFPFLFAIMFGDAGHALFIIFAGAFLVLREKHLSKYKNDEMFGMIYAGRYIILLMGLFSLYTGLIYNEIFSKSTYLFQSSWILPSETSSGLTYPLPLIPSITDLKNMISKSSSSSANLNPAHFSSSNPYPIGIDPIWMFAVNKISFLNSFKMKTSIIVGFFQMLFGIFLSAINNKFFHRKLEFYAEFIPQLLFFINIFGYLVFMIFYKWIFFNFSHPTPPSLLITLINMFLNFSKPIDDADRLYGGQKYVEMTLVVIAVLCVPWMLCVKPIILLIRNKRKSAYQIHVNQIISEEQPPPQIDSSHIEDTNIQRGDLELQPFASISEDEVHGSNEEHTNTGEILIMQLIHTIEFSLGCISNTASYLRLWALSLAHSRNFVILLLENYLSYYGIMD